AFKLYDSHHPSTETGVPPSPVAPPPRPSLLLRSRFVRSRAASIFRQLDADRSGSLSAGELYAGVLLLHLELAKYLGPAACKPPSRAVVAELFEAYDRDHSADLDEHEFVDLSLLLLSNIATRVLFQFAMTLFLVPHFAPRVLHRLLLLVAELRAADPYSLLSSASAFYAGAVLPLPYVPLLLSYVPATMALTVVSSVLVMIIVPAVLDAIDGCSVRLGELARKGWRGEKSKAA
ncbi:hypothetical protein TeGR_g6428, partial [Tetraparma gracilis]